MPATTHFPSTMALTLLSFMDNLLNVYSPNTPLKQTPVWLQSLLLHGNNSDKFTGDLHVTKPSGCFFRPCLTCIWPALLSFDNSLPLTSMTNYSVDFLSTNRVTHPFSVSSAGSLVLPLVMEFLKPQPRCSCLRILSSLELRSQLICRRLSDEHL